MEIHKELQLSQPSPNTWVNKKLHIILALPDDCMGQKLGVPTDCPSYRLVNKVIYPACSNCFVTVNSSPLLFNSVRSVCSAWLNLPGPLFWHAPPYWMPGQGWCSHVPLFPHKSQPCTFSVVVYARKVSSLSVILLLQEVGFLLSKTFIYVDEDKI